MKFSALKQLLAQLISQIKDYSSERNATDNKIVPGSKAEQLTLATDKLVEYLGSSTPLNSSSSPIFAAQQKYFTTLAYLEDTVLNIQNYVTAAEKKGVTDDDEVTDIFPPDYVEHYNSLFSNYVSLINEINKFYINKHERGTLFVGAENFEPPPALQYILKVTSGEFDLATYNEKLTQHQHTKLENGNGMNEGFYKDHDSSSFVGQRIKEAGRSASHNAIFKKCEDFVDLYLKNTQLPPEIKPNLMALVSTLAYQSGIQGITHDSLLKTVYGIFTGKGESAAGVATIAVGGDTKLYFWIDSDKNICIHALGNISPVVFDNGGYFPGESEADITKTIDIKVKVMCNDNKEPTFTLDKFELTFSCFLGKNTSEALQWGVKRRNVSEYNHNSVDQKHFTVLEDMVENLVKFAGYTSTEDWAKKNNASTAISIFSPGFYTYDLAKQKGSAIGLTSQEIKLIDEIYQGFYRDKATPEQLAKHIANFVLNALPTLSAQDQIRYIHLLKMAAYFGGPELKEVNTAFSKLLETLSKNKPLLLAALKTDIHLYRLYQSKTGGWFGGLPKLSTNEHQSILTALQDELPTFIAENPAYIKNNTDVLSFLNHSSAEEKIRFLSHYAKNAPETLNYLGKTFFNFDQHLNFDKSPHSYKALSHLIITGNKATVKALRERMPNLFDAYNVAQLNKGIDSVVEKVKLLKAVDDPIEKFGTKFMVAVTDSLRALSQNELSEAAVQDADASIRYLANTLAERKSDRSANIGDEEKEEIELCFSWLNDTYQLLSKQQERIETTKPLSDKAQTSSDIYIAPTKQIPGTEETSEKGSEEPTAKSEISVKSSAEKKESKEGSPIEKVYAEFTNIFSKGKAEKEKLSAQIKSNSSSGEQPEEEVKETKIPRK